MVYSTDNLSPHSYSLRDFFSLFFFLKILLFVVNGNKRRGQTGRIVFLFSLNAFAACPLFLIALIPFEKSFSM